MEFGSHFKRALAVALAFAAFAPAARAEVRVDIYRNLYSLDLNEVQALFEARVKPDVSYVRDTPIPVAPWARSSNERATYTTTDLMSACVIRGWIKPKVDGDYTFILPQNGAQTRFFISEDADPAHLKRLPVKVDNGFDDLKLKPGQRTDDHWKRIIVTSAYNQKPLKLKKGKKYAFRFYGVAGYGGEIPALEWAVSYNKSEATIDLDDDAALDFSADPDADDGMAMGDIKVRAVREQIPADCLVAEPEGEWAAATAYVPTPVSSVGDEPEGLDRAILRENIFAQRDFLAWYAANATPAAGNAQQAAQTVPFFRYAIKGKPDYFILDVPEDGDYRMWIRWRMNPGWSPHIHLLMTPEDDPDADLVLDQVFARGTIIRPPFNVLYPAPFAGILPGTKTGYYWEPSHRLLHLKAGRYRCKYDAGWGVTGKTTVNLEGVILDADPMREPPNEDAVRESANGRHPLCAESAALAEAMKDTAKWEAWRLDFIRRLEAPLYSDYNLGFLASRALFDPDLNAIGTPAELAAIRRSDNLGHNCGEPLIDPNPVGDGEIGFWRSPDPWGAFSRHTPPAVGTGNGDFRSYWRPKFDWTEIPKSEINRAEHDMAVRIGEVRTELVMVRNNTDKPIVLEPRVEAPGLKAKCRLVTYILPSMGVWTPKALLHREQVVAPPHQNTGLWVTLDCRGAKEGNYKTTLSFGGKAVVWNVAVKGTIEDIPAPDICPWSGPWPRTSCWEAFQDIGIDIIRYTPVTQAKLRKYGIKVMGGVPYNREDPDADHIRAVIEREAQRGLEPSDYFFGTTDEPDASGIPWVIARCDLVHGVATNGNVFLNYSAYPQPDDYPIYRELFKKIDIICPYKTTLKPGSADPFQKEWQAAGKIRLVYDTIDKGNADDGLSTPHAYLALAELASKTGRTGFAPHYMGMNAQAEDAYLLQNICTYYPGAGNTTILTRNMESLREGARRWRVAEAERRDAEAAH